MIRLQSHGLAFATDNAQSLIGLLALRVLEAQILAPARRGVLHANNPSRWLVLPGRKALYRAVRLAGAYSRQPMRGAGLQFGLIQVAALVAVRIIRRYEHLLVVGVGDGTCRRLHRRH